MIIGFDASFLRLNLQDGISVYTYNLLKHIIVELTTGHKLSLWHPRIKKYYDQELLEELLRENVQIHYSKMPDWTIKCFWKYLNFSFLKLDDFMGHLDIFHYSYFFTPSLSRKTKKVITIHDLIPIFYPEYCDFFFISYIKNILKFIPRNIDFVIVPSESTANDLMKLSGFNAKKIKIVYEGMPQDKHIATKETIENFRKRYSVGDNPYILHVGMLDKRKNLLRLVSAFARLVENDSFSDFKLILVGGNRGAYKSLMKTIKENVCLNINKKVILTDKISREDVVNSYSGASLFVMPSLYEGFGLPALEAMGYGVPTIVSNVSSLPEVVGDAAIKINPYSVEEIYEAMKTVLSNSGLRTELSQKGVERAKMFSWEKAARETLAVYEEAMRL